MFHSRDSGSKMKVDILEEPFTAVKRQTSGLSDVHWHQVLPIRARKFFHRRVHKARSCGSTWSTGTTLQLARRVANKIRTCESYKRGKSLHAAASKHWYIYFPFVKQHNCTRPSFVLIRVITIRVTPASWPFPSSSLNLIIASQRKPVKMKT